MQTLKITVFLCFIGTMISCSKPSLSLEWKQPVTEEGSIAKENFKILKPKDIKLDTTISRFLSPVFDSLLSEAELDKFNPTTHEFQCSDLCCLEIKEDINESWRVIESTRNCGLEGVEISKWIYKNKKLIFYQDVWVTDYSDTKSDHYILDELYIRNASDIKSLEREITIEEFDNHFFNKKYTSNNRTTTQIEAASRKKIEEIFTPHEF
ncbi:hypothetical protein [Flammeovirga pacifica]|uniref:Lipoprotein n=1 Tax=Flammeovirga pacifica TaxID=915059 RepID=A0A1S1YWD3_FLAPC|nr:hypothetical protein [Flammeovirga pacifica]OHX65331.1 hypothetical protein NH26_02685 [Flammeovirga pacifica]